MIQPARFKNLAAALVITALGALMTSKAITGGLVLYIHPRYTPLVLICGLILVGVGLALPLLPKLELPPSMLLLPGLVLALALLVPARPLGASLVPGKALSSNSSNALIERWQAERPSDSTVWTLLEWTAAARQQDPATLVGKPAVFEGFIYRDATLGPDEVFVGRYVVTCCTADGTAVSLRVKAPDAAAFVDDAWVRVEGTFALGEVNGEPTPHIEGTLTAIDTPASPYLYP